MQREKIELHVHEDSDHEQRKVNYMYNVVPAIGQRLFKARSQLGLA